MENFRKTCIACKKEKKQKKFRKVGTYFKSRCSKCENKFNKAYYKKKALKIKQNRWF
tara:strand:- start:6399 stop:6569 length:171 start_codon:yes stop_codon:yes gene_type:complete